MSNATLQFVNDLYVKANGQDLPAQQLTLIDSLTVEQNLYLPDVCTVVFRDIGLGHREGAPLQFGLTDANVLPIGADIQVFMGRGQKGEKVFGGEVAGHDLDIGRGAAPALVVRAYDRAHRLQRGRVSKSYLNVTDGDIAKQVAHACGLGVKADSTTQVHPYVLQNNQTNLEFLRERANRIGYETYVRDSTLYFVKPHADDGAAIEAEMWKDVLRVHVRATSTGQVQDVTVRGWDAKEKKAIVGRATGGGAARIRQKSGGELAKPFGAAHMAVTTRPIKDQAEADALAKAVAGDLTGGSVHIEGELTGRPALRPGQVIHLTSLGERFSGYYYMTSVKHHSGPGHPYTTTFVGSGRRADSMLDLVSRRGSAQPAGPDPAIVIGVVTNNKDPHNWGRVKVKLPWLAEDVETDWSRVVTPSTGNAYGFYWLPEVNDEVLVAFEQGDTGRAYVMGGLWNGKDAPPKSNDEVLDGQGRVKQRIIKSRSGHVITLDDSDDNGSIKIVDSSGQNTFTIDTKNKKITISADQDLELKAGQDVKITAGKNFSVDASQDCQIKATSNAKVSGMATTVEGTNTCEVKGNTSAKLGGAMVSVEAQGNCAVKGAIVQIN